MTEKRRRHLSNETLLITTGCFSSLANQFANPQVVLPWVYNLLGGPLFLVGMLTPSLRVGALLAQLTIVPHLLARTTRKWAYLTSVFTSAAVLVLIAATLKEMDKVEALIIFFVSLVLLGASGGITTLAMTDITAKVLPRDRIGHVLSMRVSVSGVVLLLVMLSFSYLDPDINQSDHKALMMIMAAIAWVLAGLVFACVREPPSKVSKRSSMWTEIVAGWAFVKEVPWFRRFILVRALFLSVGLATPFYSIHAAIEFSKTAHSLSLIVIATGVTSIFSAPVWSRILKKDPRKALFRSGLFAATAGVIVFVHESLGEPHPLVYMLVFAFLQLAVQGLTQSSMTYLALMCPEDERPRYLAISNAILGVLALFVSGLIGVLADSVHIYAALGLLVVLALTASRAARTLENPNR